MVDENIGIGSRPLGGSREEQVGAKPQRRAVEIKQLEAASAKNWVREDANESVPAIEKQSDDDSWGV